MPGFDWNGNGRHDAFDSFMDMKIINDATGDLSKLEPNWNGTTFFEDLANGIDNFIDLGAPLAYLGDPRIATAETGEKVYDIFSDIVTDEAEELVKK